MLRCRPSHGNVRSVRNIRISRQSRAQVKVVNDFVDRVTASCAKARTH
jgi:hypothetical protein